MMHFPFSTDACCLKNSPVSSAIIIAVFLTGTREEAVTVATCEHLEASQLSKGFTVTISGLVERLEKRSGR